MLHKLYINFLIYNLLKIIFTMKFVRKFNEELKPETYASAAAKLSRMGYTERSDELKKHSKNIDEMRGGRLWKKVLQEFAPFGSFNLNIKNTSINESFSDEFVLQISFDRISLNNLIKQQWFGFQIFLIPKSEETRQKWYKLSENTTGKSIFPMFYFNINFKIEEPSFSFNTILLSTKTPYNIRFSDRASMGKFKRLLINIFSDENFNYPYDSDSYFYNEFENFVLAELGFSSDYGLTMQMIANYINSKSANEICAKVA